MWWFLELNEIISEIFGIGEVHAECSVEAGCCSVQY